ncbi:PRC-barrel domain-containing protein [Rhodococcus sp. IEGM 1408]|uniref:PRC-barrel domain-containing protein n=1 Tax=Rhodococcus sp. IEGM 1408 TaxID=3082220 RepID=UPI0029530088|nr:PRC-barrel domain-containing protein [Rhodococcus sp. IEGM 1408]MDV8002243.1 PRC-barrel domain-containing protein [Rhodococcus sp. IEGM 1408]
MTLKDQLDALLGATVFDSTGTKIGAVRQVYVDDDSGKITFATVSTGIFSSDAIVPLHGARLLDDELHVDHTRSVIRDSPRPDHTEDALTAAQEVKLLEYYGIEPPVLAQETAPSARSAPSAPSARSAPSAPSDPSDQSAPSDPSVPSKPRSTAPQGRTPAEKPAGTESDTSPDKAGGSTPGMLGKKKTETKTTTTTSPKPEVGETRTSAKPGTTQPGTTQPGSTQPGSAQSGGTDPTGRDAGEPKGEGGSATSPDRG